MNKPVTDGEDTSGEKEGEEVVEEPAAPEVRIGGIKRVGS